MRRVLVSVGGEEKFSLDTPRAILARQAAKLGCREDHCGQFLLEASNSNTDISASSEIIQLQKLWNHPGSKGYGKNLQL